MSENQKKGMFNWFTKCVSCFKPEQQQYDLMNRQQGDGSTNTRSSRGDRTSTSRGAPLPPTSEEDSAERGNADDTLAGYWSRDLDRYCSGNFSFAVVQSNTVTEDYSQVEVGSTSTYIGVYDGHGGYRTARYVRKNLIANLMGHVRQNETMSADALRQAFLTTDNAWLAHVDAQFQSQPLVAAPGTCCLVGVIWRGVLYVANVGDSRAIIGRARDGSDDIDVEQLTRDDNVRDLVVRQEVLSLHPDEPRIVREVNGAWRIKDRIQVSKSIGDAYLKIPRFNIDQHANGRYRISTPLRRPALSAEPTPITVAIQPQDRFVIFASDGLWDQMSNQEAADFVHRGPKEGIAARLIREALGRVVINRGISFEHLQKVKVGDRRNYHDDITVVVIFLNEELQGGDIEQEFQMMSVKAGRYMRAGETDFTALDELP